MTDPDLLARFRGARLLAGLTIAEAARDLGVSASTLARVEAGRKNLPRPWVAHAKTHWQPKGGAPHPLAND